MTTMSRRATALPPLLLLTVGVAWAALATRAARAGEPAKPPAALAALAGTDLFVSGERGYALYRIPALAATGDGTLLAACEARQAGQDWGHIDLLLRRSTDGGRTWSPPAKVGDAPADAVRNPVAVARRLGREGALTINNPLLIPDRSAPKVVHLLYCVEYMRCFHRRSDDAGATWSAPVEITAALEPLRARYDWKVLATGPGHGVHLRSGRLVAPVWISTGAGGGAHRPSAVTSLISDDGGKTWKAGDIVAADPEPLKNPSETAVAELSDGRVMFNLRHEGPRNRRAVTVSPDGATGWGKVAFDEALPEPVCMGSLLRVDLDGGPLLLFSNPHNDVDRKRQNLTVKLSRDDGKTWLASKVIDPGNAGYSDLAALPDGTVFCLYERGGTANRFAALTLVRFDVRKIR